MYRPEDRNKHVLPLQREQVSRQEEVDDLVVEIIAEAIRNMRRKRQRKN